MFFPWSVIVDETAIKRALLLFDRVGVLGPSERDLQPLVSAGILSLEVALELRSSRVERQNNGLAFVLDVDRTQVSTPSAMWNRYSEMASRYG